MLLVTSDPALRAEVTRLLAPTGIDLEVSPPGATVRARWRTAAVVLAGIDALGALAGSGVGRREQVLAVGYREPALVDWQAAVEVGVSRILVVPAEERRLLELVCERPAAGSQSALVVAMVAGCGGAGASTAAAALACVASCSAATLLVDADPNAGGLDVLLGAEEFPGARWSDLALPDGALDPMAFADAVCEVAGLRVLSCGRGLDAWVSAPSAASVIDAARRGFALVVVDLPRVFDEAAEALAIAADLVVVIVPATVRAVAAAAALSAGLAARGIAPVVGVRDPGGDQLPATEVAAGLGLRLVGSFCSERSVAVAAERGAPPIPLPARSRRRATSRAKGSLHDFCAGVLSELSGQGEAA